MNRISSALAVIALTIGTPTAAQTDISTLDSFRIGNGGVLCTAQNRSGDKALSTMFDRAHIIVCRDAASDVGKLYQFQAAPPQDIQWRNETLACEPSTAVEVTGLVGVTRTQCQSSDGLRIYRYTAKKRGSHFVAQGLAGYDSALQLGLRSILAQRTVPGSVNVAVTEAGDPNAFAKVQASQLDAAQARVEGYVRNNAGSYAESATFFDVLGRSGGESTADRLAENLINQALQQSNLGDFAEAENLFEQARRAADLSDPLLTRLMRNYETMHALNRKDVEKAIATLNRPVASGIGATLDSNRLTSGYIDRPIAQKLNTSSREMAAVGGISTTLTLSEKLEILDLQSAHLRGVALRQKGDRQSAIRTIAASETGLAAMRGGRIVSVAWLRAANLTELANIADADGKHDAALRYFEAASNLLTTSYPSTAIALAGRARLASYLVSRGNAAAARPMFKAIVAESATTPGTGAMMGSLVAPYLKLLSQTEPTDADATSDFFVASQTLARPGVAQTQAVLARELSAGSDAAAALFRQSLNLSREVLRLERELAALRAKPELSDENTLRLPVAEREIAAAKAEQTRILAELGQFPRFRALSGSNVTLQELKQQLRPDEAYYKLLVNEGAVFGLFVTQSDARIVNIPISNDELSRLVADVRDSIVQIDNGSAQVFPFDIVKSRALYTAIFGSVDTQIKQVKHLVFEPDGAMLQLPVNLLVTDDESVAAYQKRSAASDGDEFDLTGTAWLGRGRIVSTSVSPKSFIDVRNLKAARGGRPFLGVGENAPIKSAAMPVKSGQNAADCNWAESLWSRPISGAELKFGANRLGLAASQVLTGAAFTDSALLARSDLADFRVIHFATHGLVTAPKPECPAQPSLLTSFGSSGSDGLLSFTEIFDLKLDADTIILSACDTAGMASMKATRAAGISTGGNYALDGLVRAFIGAGARSIVASHWPVPDDFGATETLITSLYERPGTLGLGDALGLGQQKLMDEAATSHPFYWSGFAIIGDGTRPIIGNNGTPGS
jgi:CHAT domain-containing protein